MTMTREFPEDEAGGYYIDSGLCITCQQDQFECECCPKGLHTSIYSMECDCYDPPTYDADTMKITPKGIITPSEASPRAGSTVLEKCTNAGCSNVTMYGVCLTCDPNSYKNEPTQQTMGFVSGATLPTWVPPHKHQPTHVIKGKGWNVYCGKGADCEDLANDFNLVMNLTGRSIKETHVIPMPELAKWTHGGQKFTEMLIDWPDYGVTTLPLAFWQDLLAYMEAGKLDLLVFCVGGHGRTGTAVASILIVALGYSAEKAIDWVRTNYCKKAIESVTQEEYLEDLAEAKQLFDSKK